MGIARCQSRSFWKDGCSTVDDIKLRNIARVPLKGSLRVPLRDLLNPALPVMRNIP